MLADMLRSELERLNPSNERLIVGYSGGADSTCLVHLLHQIGANFVAAHLHHQLRHEGDAELIQCQEFADSLKIDFVSGSANVREIAVHQKVGIEEAGRLARYEFLQRVALELGGTFIVTAHTLDDHLETVLLHLVRGTGLSGLAGIHDLRGNLLRPFLKVSREQTRAYCLDQNLWFHDDPDNTNPQYSRVKIREQVLPVLRTINPDVGAAIQRLAEICQSEDQFLDSAAGRFLEQCEVKLNGTLGFLTQWDEIAFRIDALQVAPEPLLRRSLRLASRYHGGTMDFDSTERAVALVMQSNGVLQIENEVELEANAQHLVVRSQRQTEVFRSNLEIGGATEASVFGWMVAAQLTSPDNFQREPGSLDVVIDADKLKMPLHFRSSQTGDKIQPLGMTGHRLVSDILSEMGLTKLARKRLPIICDFLGPIWIPGASISERVKIGSSSNVGLRLTFGEIDPKTAII